MEFTCCIYNTRVLVNSFLPRPVKTDPFVILPCLTPSKMHDAMHFKKEICLYGPMHRRG